MSEQLKFFKGDTESKLTTLANNKFLIPGALYHCLDSGNTYLATSNETKQLFSTINMDWFKKGTYLAENTNLDTLSSVENIGKYACQTVDISKTITGTPKHLQDNPDNFVLYVLSRTSDEYLTQMIITLRGELYIRSESSSGWGDWTRKLNDGEATRVSIVRWG